MIDHLVEAGLSNSCIALGLAAIAMLVGAKANRPQLTHLLWVLVLAKLITPPLWFLPIDLPAAPSPASPPVALEGPQLAPLSIAGLNLNGVTADDQWTSASQVAVVVWLAGSGLLLTYSLVRVARFNACLQSNAQRAPRHILRMARNLSARLQLRTVPDVCITTANVSPLVWWTGGNIRIVLPANLLDELDFSGVRWVVAHELAHIRRRDYLVRWLEWSAQVVFWWNPVVWQARRSLRLCEEICCDDLVIASLHAEPRTYAESILHAIESLARPIIRPPAMASGVNSGGSLERRFRMMVQPRRIRVESHSLRNAVALVAIGILPWGIAYAQNFEAVEERLRDAVHAEELTDEQARFMLGALHLAHELQERPEHDPDHEELRRIEEELSERVEAGEISEEEAHAELEAIHHEFTRRHERHQQRRLHEQLARAEHEIDRLLSEGEISEEEAVDRIHAMHRRLAEREEREQWRAEGEDLFGEEAEILGLVADDKLSAREARARLQHLQERMLERQLQLRDRMRRAREREDKGEPEINWEDVERRIESAVEEGALSRELADAAYHGIKARLANARREYRREAAEERLLDGEIDGRTHDHFEALMDRIEHALDRGEISPDEAEAKREAVRERFERRERE